MKELAQELNAKGIKNKRGGAMNINSIARMLQNRHYIGEYSYKDIVTPDGVLQLFRKKRCGCDKKAIRKDWIKDIVMAQFKADNF